MSVKFLIGDSLTGAVKGQLEPKSWELPDPLRSPGAGTLTIPLPTDLTKRRYLRDLTQPRTRFLAVMDELGRFIWSGPITRRPGKNGGEIVVPVSDWRAWFYRAYIRPIGTTRRNYIKTGVNATEQCLIMANLAALALATVGAPRLAVDAPPTSGTERELTAMMLDRPIGEHLDSITERSGGCEWYCYTTGDESNLLPHFAVAWPERRSTTSPVRVEHILGSGGNVADYSWPEGADVSTRVWAVGDGDPPAQVFTSDEYQEIADGTEVAWETLLGPLDGVAKIATALEYASAEIDRSQGLEGLAEFSIPDERIALGNITTGDRAHIILTDGWADIDGTIDVPAARIVERTLSGGRDQPTLQRITVDLSDDDYPDAVTGETV